MVVEEDIIYMWLNCEENLKRKSMKYILIIISWYFVIKDLKNFIVFYIYIILEIYVC